MPHVDGDDDGVGYGVVGSSSRSIGILGKSDSGYGIFGSSSSGDGVVGSSRNKNGVNGWSTEVDGVHGVSSLGYGVYGYSSNPKLSGVYGENGNVDSTCTGVHGWCYRGSGVLGFSPFGYGVTGGSEDGYGVYGGSFSGDGVFGVSVSRFGLHGSCPSEVVVDSDGNLIIGGCGVCGDSISGVGVYGRSRDGDGVRGCYHSLFSSGVLGMNDRGVGVFGFSDTGDSVYGYSNSGRAIYGTSPSPNGYAAYLDGRVYIGGPLEKPGGSFKIDHPLDPTNKFLCHSFVESPDMQNVYDGVVVLDDNGESEIELPDWFGALNKDFRYQLTAIGVLLGQISISQRKYLTRLRTTVVIIAE